MRQAKILFKDEEAGLLIQHDNGSFTFRYYQSWIANNQKSAISPTLPKTEKEFHANFLFPFFFHILPEGSNKDVICKLNRINRNDYFGLLSVVAKNDSIGAVRVIKID